MRRRASASCPRRSSPSIATRTRRRGTSPTSLRAASRKAEPEKSSRAPPYTSRAILRMRFRTTAPPAVRPSATISRPPAVIPGATHTVQGPPCTLTPDRRIWPAGEAAFFLMREASHREAVAPLGSAALDHLLAIRRTHSLQESVRSSALAAIRLIGSLHGYGSLKTVKRVSYVSRVAMSSVGLLLASFLFALSRLAASLLAFSAPSTETRASPFASPIPANKRPYRPPPSSTPRP